MTTHDLFAETGDFDYLLFAVAYLEYSHPDVFGEACQALDGVRKHIEAQKASHEALKTHHKWMLDILRRLYADIEVDYAEMDDCIEEALKKWPPDY